VTNKPLINRTANGVAAPKRGFAKPHETLMNPNGLNPYPVTASGIYYKPAARPSQLTEVPPRSAATSIVLAELSRRKMELRRARKRRWEKVRRAFSAPFCWLHSTRPGKLWVVFTASGPLVYRRPDACGAEG
jgi:hypothetical protein